MQQRGLKQETTPQVQLTPDELSQLMREAIAQHGAAEQAREANTRLATLEDAVDIAKQVGIPTEYVVSAAQEMQRRKLRETKRQVARARRMVPFAACAILAVVLVLTPLNIVGLVLAVLAVFLGWRWLGAPVSDAEADAVDVAPQPGVCRVCGRPAYAPNASFCEEHRYKGPSA